MRKAIVFCTVFLAILAAASTVGAQTTDVPATDGILSGDIETPDGQIEPDRTQVPWHYGSRLSRTGFNRLNISDYIHSEQSNRTFSFRMANLFIDDPSVVARLQSGLRMEKTALGLGVFGATLMSAGIFALTSDIHIFGSSDRFWMSQDILGYCLVSAGSAMGLAAVITGTVGAVRIKNAIRGYNSGREIRLGFSMTPGRVGMQSASDKQAPPAPQNSLVWNVCTPVGI